MAESNDCDGVSPPSSSNDCSVSFQGSDSSPTGNSTDPCPKRDYIITYLHRVANETADQIPDTNEQHLPFITKLSVYEHFKTQFSILYTTEQCPDSQYFYKVWSAHCSSIKVRKSSRFTKCSTCERIRAALLTAVTKNQPTDTILQQNNNHLEFVNRERLEYKSKTEDAILKPMQYMSIVIDGADQSAYSLRHFTSSVKEQRGLGMKVHLVGLLQHGRPNVLNLYTMTDEHQKGSNHIVEVLQRFVNAKARYGHLPKRLFIQLDNFSRENKNKFFPSYLDALVRWAVFDVIEVGFLPVGNTHCDIDQSFSATSNRLRTHDAITLSDLQNQLRQCYNEHTNVMELNQIANWSGLCHDTKCCHIIDRITQYRFFKFNSSQNQEVTDSAIRTVVCEVRHAAKDDWVTLQSVNNGTESFLPFFPDLTQTPPEVIEELPDVHKVTQRIQSEAGRIQSEEKISELVKLRDDVFRSRFVRFHWDLSIAIECNSSVESAEAGGITSDTYHNAPNEGISNDIVEPPSLVYSMNSFVAVMGVGGDMATEFWIGRVVGTARRTTRQEASLRVHWHEFYGAGDIYTAKYRELYKISRSTGKKTVRWIDTISCRSVLTSFSGLTKSKRLQKNVSNDLRERVGA